MNVKRLFFAGVASLLAVGAMAQFRPSIIVSAGYQGANLMLKDQDQIGNSLKHGFRVGAAVDIPVLEFGMGHLSIQPGIYYSQKGARSEFKGSLLPSNISATTTLGYVELPILANLQFGLTDMVGVYVNAGPYLAYGIHSKFDFKGELGSGENKLSLPYENTSNLFKGDKGLKPFDAGVHVGAGLEISRFQVGVGTQFGLANMLRSDKASQKNQTFFVTAGYRF